MTKVDTVPEVRAQLALAVPLAMQQVGLQLMGAVDAAMLGRWDQSALAGAGVANGLVFTITCIGMGIVMGLDALVPQALGAGERDNARALLRGGLRVALIVGLPATLLVLASPLALGAFGVDENVAYQAKIFVWARAFGVAPFMLQVALRAYLSAHGKTRPLIVAVIAGNLINFALDYLLIFGVPSLGIPEMGVIGAAAATSAVQIANLVFYAFAVRALHRGEPPLAPAPGSVRKIFQLGTPIGLQLLAEVGMFALAGVLAATLGPTPAAAHSVAIQLASFTFSMAVGIGAATSVRVGRAVGAGIPGGARRAGTVGLGLGFAIMTSSALVFLAMPGPLARLFTEDETVIAAAIPLLQIAAVFQISDGAQAVAGSALRGAGDTRALFVANLVGHYTVGIGVSLILGFGVGLGAPGLWWGLSAGLTATAVLLIIRFWRVTGTTIARA
jgi:multidrug resistance protein, MATE family